MSLIEQEPEQFVSMACDASVDGSIVVGNAGAKISTSVAAAWGTASDAVELVVGSSTTRSVANDISSDGTSIVGGTGGISDQMAFMDVRTVNPILLGGLKPQKGNNISSEANGVSADGSRIAGRSDGVDGRRAVLWMH